MPRGQIKYNTSSSEMEISEYGRNVQNMVEYIKGIEDKEGRQKHAEAIVNLLAIMNPSNKHLAEYKEKLWNHLFRIASYELDVDIPEGISIHKKERVRLDKHLPYPQSHYRNRHYGKYIQTMISKALELEPGEKRDAFANIIASYMKLAYRTWNKEHFVSDDIIIQDLKEISHGQINFSEDYSIENLISMKNTKLGVGPAPAPSSYKNFKNKNKQGGNNNNNNNSSNKNKKFKKRK